jgi:glycogen(starch) synthase
MRLLHVTHQYPPAVGGAERHIAGLSAELVRRGHQVDVFTARSVDANSWAGVLPAYEELDGVRVHRFEGMQRGPRTWKVLNWALQGYWRNRWACYAPFIAWGNGPVSPAMTWRLLRQAGQYDLVHVNSLHYAPVSLTFLATRFHAVPLAVTPFVHIDQPVVFDIGFQNGILRRADLVLAMTGREKAYLAERGVARSRVAVAGSGIALEDFPRRDVRACRKRLRLDPNAFILLFLGRKEPYKGLETLLQAHAQLQDLCPDLHLVAAGQETEHSLALRQRFAGLERVVFLDRVSDDEKLDLLNACDVFALPSVGESFGIVYLEAWAVGKPVIGADSGATPSVITDGVDGLLVTPGSASDVADKITRLYQDGALRERMGAAGHFKASARYSVQRVADVVEGAYVRTVRQHRNTQQRGVREP